MSKENVINCIVEQIKKTKGAGDLIDDTAKFAEEVYAESLEQRVGNLSEMDAVKRLARQKVVDNMQDKLLLKEITDELDKFSSDPVKQMDMLRSYIIQSDSASLTRAIKSKESELVATFYTNLGDAGSAMYRKLQNNLDSKGEMNAHVTKGLFELRNLEGDPVKHLQSVGYSLDDAEGISELYTAMRHLQNDIHASKKEVGILLGRQDDYLFKTTYDDIKLSRFTSDEFAEFVLPKLNVEETFAPSLHNNPEAQLRILKQVHKDILSSTAAGIENNTGATISSQLRSKKFFFTDSQAEFDMHQAFATTNRLADIVNHEARTASHMTQVKAMLGSNPDKTIKKAMEHVKNNAAEKIGQTGGDASTIMTDKIKKIEAQIDKAKDTVIARPNTTYGLFGESVNIARNAIMPMLASVTWTNAPQDFATSFLKVFETRGSDFMSSLELIKNWFKGTKIDVHQEAGALNAIGMTLEMSIASGAKRHENMVVAGLQQEARGMSAVVAHVSNKIIKASGLDWITDKNRMGAIFTGNSTLQLTLRAVKNGEYNPVSNRMFEQMRLNESDLSILTENLDNLYGVEFKQAKSWQDDMLNIDKIRNLDLDKIDPRIKEIQAQIEGGNITSAEAQVLTKKLNGIKGAASRKRSQLHRKVQSWMSGLQDGSVPVPDMEHKLVNRGKAQLDDTAVMLNSMMTFKDSVWAMTNNVSRTLGNIYQDQGASGVAKAGAAFAGGSIAMTLVSDMIYSVMTNKKSLVEQMYEGDPTEAAFKMANYASPIPFWSDMITKPMEAYVRTGGNKAATTKAFTSSVAGPLAGQAAELTFNAMDIAGTGDATGLARQGYDRILPTNLWWVKGTMRHMGYNPNPFSPKGHKINKNKAMHKGLLND